MSMFVPLLAVCPAQLLRFCGASPIRSGMVSPIAPDPAALDDPAVRDAAAVEDLGAAFLIVDGSGLVARWTGAAPALFGWSEAELAGASFIELTDPGAAEAALAAVAAGERWEGELPIRRKDGRSVLTWFVAAPTQQAGRPNDLVGVAFDITDRHMAEAERAAIIGRERAARAEAEDARRAAELAAERTSRLRSLAAALAEARSLPEVFTAAVEQGVQALHARSGAVAIVSSRPDGSLDVVTQLAGSGPIAPNRLSINDDHPLAVAARTGEVCSSTDSISPWYGIDAIPLVWNDKVIGGIAIDFARSPTREAEEHPQEDVEFLQTLAQQCAQGVERIRLFESQQRAQRRLRFLADASHLLAWSLNYEETASRVVQRVVPDLADWCTLHVVGNDGRVRLVAAAARDRTAVAALQALWQRENSGAPPVVEEVLTAARSAFHPFDPARVVDLLSRDDAERDVWKVIDASSCVVAPLVVQGRRLGVVSLGTSHETRSLDFDDLAFAEDLGRRLAVAIDNSVLYTERTEVARKLQQALLPPALPSAPGFEVAYRYQASGAGNEVGGDFYDMFALDDGSWALAVGDVCGKGPEAAAITGLARHTVRAVAMYDRRPARILAGLNEALLSQQSDRFCTVCFVRFEPVPSGGARLTVCSAGHPLPMVVTSAGEVRVVGVPGTPAGMFAEIHVSDVVDRLDPGDSLVLYTDGVTERHEGAAAFGDDSLARVLSESHSGSADEIATAVATAVIGFTDQPLRDDMAVLVLKAL